MAWLRHKMPQRLKLKPTDNFHLGELKLDETEIRCRHLRSSQWGVLAHYRKDGCKQPTWILYAQLDIQQLGNNRLKYTKLSLDFESETGESDGVIVTTYYGPKHIRGPLETRVCHQKRVLDPHVGVGQIMVQLGALEWETSQERTERWHFVAASKTGRVGDGLSRCIDWTITEARHAADTNHNPEWKLGVVLTHDGKDFNMHLDISVAFIIAKRIFQFRSKTAKTRTEVAPPQKNLEDWPELDETATQLPSDLESENLIPVPTMGQD